MKNNDINKVWKVLLDIVSEITRICDEEKIRYFMVGGTQLGAIRHKGFIPWDDDLDIAMSRSDYEKFLKIIPSKLSNNLKLSHYTNDKTTNVQFAKIVNMDYEILEKKGENGEVVINNNVFVDIFPFDNIPDNKLKAMVFKLKLYYRIFKTRIVRMGVIYKDGYTGTKKLKKIIFKLFAKGYNQEDLISEYEKLENVGKKYSNEKNNKYIICYQSLKYDIVKREIFKKEKFYIFKKYKFQDIKMYGIVNYDYYLSQKYGDYMKLPPIEERVGGHISELKCVKN